MKKVIVGMLLMISFTMSMTLFTQNVDAAPVKTVTEHKHNFYGPYKIKISGLTMYPGYLTYAYVCGQPKPYSSYWGYDLTGL